ncbi:MAG TPA: MYXO-CTERM sorting domain-containing protein [Nannocystis sp.]|jgi:MYXO-CTERM domain-containing protein
MTCHRLAPVLAALLTLAGVVPSAQASFPAGVWALVEKVTLEPNADAPNTIRIDGIFMIAKQLPDFAQYPGYGEPQVGYMYYSCAEKNLATCVMEWKELLAVAGTEDNCRGWGEQSLPDNGSVRPAPQPQADPDLYPIAMGVLVGFTPCDALRAWQLDHGTTGESGDTTSTTGDTGTAGESSTTGESASSNATGDTAASTSTATNGDTATGDPQTSGDTGKTATGDPQTTGDASGLGGDTGGDSPTVASAGDSTGGSNSSSSASDSGNLDDDKGCACTTGPGQNMQGALAMLAALALLRRRRSAA